MDNKYADLLETLPPKAKDFLLINLEIKRIAKSMQQDYEDIGTLAVLFDALSHDDTSILFATMFIGMEEEKDNDSELIKHAIMQSLAKTGESILTKDEVPPDVVTEYIKRVNSKARIGVLVLTDMITKKTSENKSVKLSLLGLRSNLIWTEALLKILEGIPNNENCNKISTVLLVLGDDAIYGSEWIRLVDLSFDISDIPKDKLRELDMVAKMIVDFADKLDNGDLQNRIKDHPYLNNPAYLN